MEIKQGCVAVTLPEGLELPREAGSLGTAEVRRLPRARPGIGLACSNTAQAMRQSPERLGVPGLDPDALEASGSRAEAIDLVIDDLEVLLMQLKQANLILDAEAHNNARRVLAFVRAQEKFDPTLSALVPHLVGYFGG